MSREARLEILTRINRATGPAQEPLQRPVVTASVRPHAEIVTQFAEYAAEYRANVRLCLASELPGVLVELLVGRRVLTPDGLPAAWLTGIEAVPDQGQSHQALAGLDAVLTLCAVAVAETGTVVLDHGPGQGRRALTLIPDHHVCVVQTRQVVESVPQAVAVLQSAVTAGRPLTWISGPSATSDIELSRVEGVHGPRRLDIVLVS